MFEPKELKVNNHYIPKLRGMIVYCERAHQKLKKCNKCSIHLFHNRAGFPLFCIPYEKYPKDYIYIENEAEIVHPSTKENVLHVIEEKK